MTIADPLAQYLKGRRTSAHLVPIPASQRNKMQQQQQGDLGLEDKTKENPIINRIRRQVKKWRAEPPEQWKVTYETQTLLICGSALLFVMGIQIREIPETKWQKILVLKVVC